MKKTFIFFLLLFIVFNFFGISKEDINIKTEKEYTFKINQKLTIEVRLEIPKGYNIYVSPVSDESFSYFTKINIIDPDKNFKILKVKNPKGQKNGTDTILKKKGSYFIDIINTKEIPLSLTKVDLVIEVEAQMCNYKSGLCYPPKKYQKSIVLNIEK